jgi:hypothetical protein
LLGFFLFKSGTDLHHGRRVGDGALRRREQ